MKKVLAVIVAFVLCLSMAACGNSSTDTAASSSVSSSDSSAAVEHTPITIKLSGAFAEGTDHYFFFEEFCKTVNEMSDGSVTVVWGNGPEAIPSDQLAEAMQNGVVELVYTPLAYVVTVAPGLAGVKLTDPETMRASGGVEYIDSITSDTLKAHYLCRTDDGSGFALAMKGDITATADFKGKTIRGTSATKPLIEAIGAEMVTMGWADVYQAFDKGVIQGAGGTLKDFSDNDLAPVIGTLVQPNVFNSDSSLLIANHIWEKLDDVQKTAIEFAAVDWERAGKQHNAELNAKVIADLEAAGVKVVDLGEEYSEVAYAAAWKITEDADAEIAAKLKEFSGN